MQRSLGVAGVVAFLAACGGGEPITPVEETPGGVINVYVSVGTPLAGVTAVAYAIHPVTGKPIEDRADGAILAEATASSIEGRLELRLAEDVMWNGPVQVVVTGSDIRYEDPTGDEAGTLVSLPDSFRLTSYVQRFRSGTTVDVSVSLWTTLADAAALAYAEGRTSGASAGPFERALPIIDNLFSMHVSRPISWDMRASVPVDGRARAGSVRDVVFASIADIALNQLARDISITAGHEPGSVITAYQLLELLVADISDGLFDGLEGEVQLAARGGVYELTSRTTRFDLARALGAFIDSPANATGLTRKSLESYSVFDNIALDRNFLYPADEDPGAFDALPPEIELLEPLPEYVSERELLVRVRAFDGGAGVATVRAEVQSGDGAKDFEAKLVGDYWQFAFEVKSGLNALRIWAEDAAVPLNSGKDWGPPHAAIGSIILDESQPTVTAMSARSHRNEDGALLVMAGDAPVVPGKLNLSDKSLEDLGSEGTIKKTYATSSWGSTPPTGKELNEGNPRNLPFRRFSVAYSEEHLQAPLAAVTWRFEAQAEGSGTVHISEGEAIPSAIENSGARIFEVVFSQETIPLLKTTTSRSVTLKLNVFATDAAGNTYTAGPFEHSYQFVDTPLHFTVDTTYPAQGSPKSLYGYWTNRPQYRDLFSSTSQVAKNGAARVGRVVVLNPWPVPIALRQVGAPQFTFSENWKNSLAPIADATTSMDGMTFNRFEDWASGQNIPDYSCLRAFDSVCGIGWGSARHIRHDKWSSSRLVCGSGTTPPSKRFALGDARLTHASAHYVVTEPVEEGQPDELAEEVEGSGSALVPAATSAGAGRVVVFPGISSTHFIRDFGAGWDGDSSYVQVAGIFYAAAGPGAMCDERFGEKRVTSRYEAMTWSQTLLSAQSNFAGSHLEFQGRPVYTDGSIRAEVGPVPVAAKVPFSVNFVHVKGN